MYFIHKFCVFHFYKNYYMINIKICFNKKYHWIQKLTLPSGDLVSTQMSCVAGSSGGCGRGGGIFIPPIIPGGIPLENPGGGIEKLGGGKFGGGIKGLYR